MTVCNASADGKAQVFTPAVELDCFGYVTLMRKYMWRWEWEGNIKMDPKEVG